VRTLGQPGATVLGMVQADPVSVNDPIFPSLWEATLSELGHETQVWEVFADAENFLSGSSPDLQADEAEETLRRIRDEGWAMISRRALDAPPDATPTPLSAGEIADAVARARAWFLTERAAGRAVPSDLRPMSLEPSAKWLEWDAARRRSG
jgi:hypothetical protein